LYAKLLDGYVEYQDWGEHNPVSISFGALARDNDHRREIVERLVANGIETRIYSAGNLGRHPFWARRYGTYEEVMSDKIHSNGFFVPNYPEMSKEDIKFICDVIKGET
jgi:CDP-6-deoxy-D-xylo-4-hexulose-3-dehydrase